LRFRLLMRLLAAAVVLSSAAAAAQSGDPTPEAVALSFYERYGAGDLDGLSALATAELAPALRTKLGGRFRTRCLHLVRATSDAASMTGNEAVVHVDALLTVRPRNGGERFEPHAATFRLTPDRGGWRIANWELHEESVVRTIAAAPSDEARDAVLAGDPAAATPLLAQLLTDRALQASNQQQYDLALSLAALAEQIARASGDLAGVSLGRGIESIVFRRQVPGRPVDALRAANESVSLAEAADDPDTLAKALLRLGRTQSEQLLAEAPLDPFERVLALREDLEDPSTAAHAASQLAGHYGDLADHYRSLGYAHLAQHLAAASGNLMPAIAAELNIAGTYRAEGDYEIAIGHLKEALRLAHLAKFRDGELAIPAELAAVYREFGDTSAYLPLTNEVLRAEPPPDIAAPLLYDRADYFLERGELARAGRDAAASLATSLKANDPRLKVQARQALARVRLAQGRLRETLELLDAPGAERMDRFPRVALRAKTLRRMGRRREAVAAYRNALDLTEGARAAVAGDDRQRRLFFATRAETYVELADLLAELGDPLGALAVADESKGRALLDILVAGRSSSADTMSDAERTRERELTARVAALRAKNAAANEPELQQAYTALDAFRADVETRHPDLRLQREVSAPVTKESLAALLPDRRTAFVEYAMTGSRLQAFVVRQGAQGTHVTVRTTSVSRRTLERESSRLVATIVANGFGYEAPARKLYDLLLRPLAADLEGVKTICIIPDGALWQVPFEALLAPDRHFVASRVATFYAPSIAVYARMARGPAPRPATAATFLAFADPPVPAAQDPARMAVRSSELAPLPDAAREVEQIARLYGARRASVHVGSDALEQRVKESSGRYDVLHFATHGVLDDRNPMYSHLLLAASPGGTGDDGLLEAWEMMRLDLHAELTVLSACDTARGKFGAGEGIIGMSWALFAAGCPSTIATEWKVDSASAADLMLGFYRQWLHGHPATHFAKAEALQRARLQLLRDPRRRHPFYWASYVLIGSGR
jgi:CHAT domain-containing protein